MRVEARPMTLEVLNPVSEIKITAQNAPRLDTLDGKTICEVWATGRWGGERTFPVIRGLLQKRFSNLKFVPYTELPRGAGIGGSFDLSIPLDKVGKLLKEKGCDAVLLGNGG